MGCFTTIKDQEKNLSIQIHGGDDVCETYLIGEKVPQKPNPYNPGVVYFEDGMYEGLGERPINSKVCLEYWVIIKNATVIAIEDKTEDNYQEIWQKYELKENNHPRELWSEELWKEKEERELQHKKDWKEFMRSISHLSTEERLGKIMAKPLLRAMGCDGLAKQILSIEPLDLKLTK